MPSFIGPEQVAEVDAYEKRLQPYLDEAFKTVSDSALDADSPATEAASSSLSPRREGSPHEGVPRQPSVARLLDPPKLSIAILVIGTRGDVQPFLRIGQRLKEDGHRVRLATHGQYEALVREGGLGFYSLGGDPKELSMHMCRTGGRLMPNMLVKEERDNTVEKMAMLREMMFATWPACSEPEAKSTDSFRADAIIANPVAYGHVHVAERLDVPVHLMFPQPWTPTRELPHPLSIWGRGCTQRDFLPSGIDAVLRRTNNWASYFGIDAFLYTGMRAMTNEFRESMGLKKIRAGEEGAYIIHTHQVPFAYQWSPLVLPRPEDYGPHVEVTGTIFNNDGASYQPTPELEAWLREREEPPVFVGFGSMIIAEPEELAGLILEAAKLSDTRVLLQSSWSSLTLDDGGGGLVFQLGNCPHEWLFEHVAAVVHHGGAGTAAAGLRAGVPTFICPFFGDQHLWAQALLHAGASVAPVPIEQLTAESLAAAFRTMRGLDEAGAVMKTRARNLGKQLAREDGVAGAVDAFYRHLPLEGLACDASLWLQGDVRVARWHSRPLGVKLCGEAYAALRAKLPPKVLQDCGFEPYHCRMDWAFSEPANFLEGMKQGIKTAAARYAEAGCDLVVTPLRGGYEGGLDGGGVMGALGGGVIGAGAGVVQSLQHVASGTKRLFVRPMRGWRRTKANNNNNNNERSSVSSNDRTEARTVESFIQTAVPEVTEDADRLLDACVAALVLRTAWDARCADGQLALGSLGALLAELGYPRESVAAVCKLLGVEPPVEPVDQGGSFLQRMTRKVNAFTGQEEYHFGDVTRAVARRLMQGSASVETERTLCLEELAFLLQRQGPPPKVASCSAEEAVNRALALAAERASLC